MLIYLLFSGYTPLFAVTGRLALTVLPILGGSNRAGTACGRDPVSSSGRAWACCLAACTCNLASMVISCHVLRLGCVERAEQMEGGRRLSSARGFALPKAPRRRCRWVGGLPVVGINHRER